MAKTESGGFSFVREIQVQWGTDGSYSISRASDISSAGAFIVAASPLPAGTTIGLRLEVGGRQIVVQAVVRRAIPCEGMGVEFQLISPEDQASLERMVRGAEPAEGELPNVEPLSATASRESGSAPPDKPQTRPRTSPERRLRARYTFSATVEIIEARSGQSVSGELSNIGHSGCYVKMEVPLSVGASVKAAITHHGQTFCADAIVKSSQPEKGMGLTFIDVDDPNLKVLEEWLAVSAERAWLATNRRRGQRVMVSIPVEVEAKDRWGREHREEAKTISVSANGALLALDMELTKGQTVTLRDPASHDALECSVAYLGSSHQGRREVGVSFVQPNKCLWKIAFPPSDWSVQDPYAKSS